MYILSKVFVVLVYLAGCIYSLVIQSKHSTPTFFKFATFGIFCQFFSSLYYLALSTDSSLTNLFTLGIFGELAQFLFLMTSNLYCLPEGTKPAKRFSLKGFLFVTVILILIVFDIVLDNSLQNVVYMCLYAIVFVPCGYVVVKNMEERRKDAFFKAIFIYNLLNSSYFILFGLLQSALVISLKNGSEPLFYLGFILPCVILAVVQVVSLVLLRKELMPWEK